MTKFLLLLFALVGCSLPDKNHCAVTSDCLGGQVCRAGVCETTTDDACGADHARCAADATCVDSPSGAACMCNAGFSGDGLSCADTDECAAATSPCAAHAACTNVTASFSCACESGFTGDGTGYCVPSKFTKIVAAGGFSCGLAGDGGIYCWGNNTLANLGDGTLLPHARPVQVGTATDWIDVDARANTGCGLRADHSIWCWGNGTNGQLGDGRMVTELAPTEVVSDKPGIGWKAMSVGRAAVCAIHLDGSLACWGLDRITKASIATPTAVDANTDWTDISVGTVRCGLRGSPGHLFCWGSSNDGDLGLGDTSSAATPTQVGTDTWRTIEVGYYNTCAIRSDGGLWCWGDGLFAGIALQYGKVPQQVGTETDWQAISLSDFQAIGLRAGGHAYAWGFNERGQLGLPIVSEVTTPTALDGPVTSWSQISSGNVHGCGIADGQAYCWGSVGEGLLGNGAATVRMAPTKIGSDSWTALADDRAAQCGLRSDGALLCRGNDPFLGIGLGTTDPVWTPTRIGSDTWSALAGSHSAFGLDSLCGIRGGAPYCWGDNSLGQLGLGNTDTPQLAPAAVAVPPGTQWTEIAAGEHTCAIQAGGTLWCWGANDSGQLGTGQISATPTTAPASPLPGSWLHVAVMSYGFQRAATCGIKSDRTLWCWGADQPPATTTHLVPTQVGTDNTWVSVAMGPTFSSAFPDGGEICAIKADGTLWCSGIWLGDGSTATSPTPVQVGTATDWKTVAVGNEICGTRGTGTLWCWANLDYLGNGTPVFYDTTQFVAPATLPTQIGSDADWSTVVTNGRTCATKTDGTLWCWGYGAAAEPDAVPTPTPIR